MVNEFTKQMKAAVEETKSAIWKTQKDMTCYYNQRRSPAPVFHPGDQIFLDASNIKTTCLSLKLLHHCLGPFIVECQVEPSTYHLKLPYTMKKLHPVFNIVKLSTTPEDPILGQRPQLLPPLIIINGKEEWEVEKILDSRWYRRRFQFLVK